MTVYEHDGWTALDAARHLMATASYEPGRPMPAGLAHVLCNLGPVGVDRAGRYGFGCGFMGGDELGYMTHLSFRDGTTEAEARAAMLAIADALRPLVERVDLNQPDDLDRLDDDDPPDDPDDGPNGGGGEHAPQPLAA